MTGVAGRPANDHCTCAEVAGENPRCSIHGVEITIQKLRLIEATNRDDVDTLHMAADYLETFWDDLNAPS